MKTTDIYSLVIGVHDDTSGNGIQLSNFELVGKKLCKCNLAAVSGRFSYNGPLWMEGYAESVLCVEDEHNRMGGYISLHCHEEHDTSLNIQGITASNTIRIKGSFRHYKDEENTDQSLRLDMVIPDNGGFRRLAEGWERILVELLGTPRTDRSQAERQTTMQVTSDGS